jgi:N-acetylglutamate synthase-like GNAT family acetyltransferase
MVDIEGMQGEGLARIHAFYEQVGYGGSASAADIVLAATAGERVIGVVRLCEENGVTVLRGMHVAPACQRRGIGRALLARCLPWLNDGVAFCLPYEHLAGFYAQAGFIPALKETLPPFLAERLDAYLSKGQRVLAMRRPGPDYMPNKSLASRMA